MSKLFKLKRWFTLSEAAKRLSISFGEEVSQADVLHFALEGHLKISVYLVNGARACPCIKISPNDIETEEVPSLDGKSIIKIPKYRIFYESDKGCFRISDAAIKLDSDVYDVPMLGGERLDVEQAYQALTAGPDVTGVSLEGIFLTSTNGGVFEIQEEYEPAVLKQLKENSKSPIPPRGFHPAGVLPEDSVFVVRTDALRDFEQSVSEPQTNLEKPLTTRERDTLLTIIAALAKEAKINIEAPGKAAAFIEGLTDLLGAHVSKRAIEDHLKKIPDAMEVRMK